MLAARSHRPWVALWMSVPPPTLVARSAPQDRRRKSSHIHANYRIIIAFSAEKPDRILRIIAQSTHFRAKGLVLAMTFCHASFFFIHIPGGSFIFNISFVARGFSDAG